MQSDRYLPNFILYLTKRYITADRAAIIKQIFVKLLIEPWRDMVWSRDSNPESLTDEEKLLYLYFWQRLFQFSCLPKVK